VPQIQNSTFRINAGSRNWNKLVSPAVYAAKAATDHVDVERMQGESEGLA